MSASFAKGPCDIWHAMVVQRRFLQSTTILYNMFQGYFKE